MKFLLVVILIPLLLIPLAAIGLHIVACYMHIVAVDGMRDKLASTNRKGWFYGYCILMAGIMRPVG